MWTVEIQSNGAAALEDRQSFPAMTSASSYPLTCIRRWFSLWLWWRLVLILLLWTVPFTKSYTQRQVAMTFDTHCLLIWGLADCIRLSSDNTNTLWFAIFVRMIYIHWAMLNPVMQLWSVIFTGRTSLKCPHNPQSHQTVGTFPLYIFIVNAGCYCCI